MGDSVLGGGIRNYYGMLNTFLNMHHCRYEKYPCVVTWDSKFISELLYLCYPYEKLMESSSEKKAANFFVSPKKTSAVL